jgi:hypothetical protein
MKGNQSAQGKSTSNVIHRLSMRDYGSSVYNGNQWNRKDEEMLTISTYSVELVKDPFGILTGKRYEFRLDLELPEEDELQSENGVHARVIFKVDEQQSTIISYDLMGKSTNKVLDIGLEADEEEALADFCREHLPE